MGAGREKVTFPHGELLCGFGGQDLPLTFYNTLNDRNTDASHKEPQLDTDLLEEEAA